MTSAPHSQYNSSKLLCQQGKHLPAREKKIRPDTWMQTRHCEPRTKRLPMWHLSWHLCRPQFKVLEHGNGQMCSMSMQHNWLQLCLPQDLFFLQRFSQRASSALVVRSLQAISRSMLPHRHFTSVLRSQLGHSPTWHGALQRWGLPVRTNGHICSPRSTTCLCTEERVVCKTLTRLTAL